MEVVLIRASESHCVASWQSGVGEYVHGLRRTADFNGDGCEDLLLRVGAESGRTIILSGSDLSELASHGTLLDSAWAPGIRRIGRVMVRGLEGGRVLVWHDHGLEPSTHALGPLGWMTGKSSPLEVLSLHFDADGLTFAGWPEEGSVYIPCPRPRFGALVLSEGESATLFISAFRRGGEDGSSVDGGGVLAAIDVNAQRLEWTVETGDWGNGEMGPSSVARRMVEWVDVSGDGVPDIALSADDSNLGTGEVLIVDAVNGRLLDRLWPEADVRRAGQALSIGGDWDGDGLPELLVGSGTLNTGRPGKIIVFGSRELVVEATITAEDLR